MFIAINFIAKTAQLLIHEYMDVILTNHLIKGGLLPSKNVYFYLLQWQPFKIDEKCFLFHLKSSFHSQDI